MESAVQFVESTTLPRLIKGFARVSPNILENVYVLPITYRSSADNGLLKWSVTNFVSEQLAFELNSTENALKGCELYIVSEHRFIRSRLSEWGSSLKQVLLYCLKAQSSG
ncbi:unnamed protein product [Hymenolepis diminuta]|uniref:Uncharacterized protein n=1 Tax=Hymenolepis diminuta TaxID=6216 RepID=A0A564YMY6_HYMDI|nr:unnamed protein product [Hymenolepis diminuta]